jgi:putative oxidoreductase
MSWERVLQRLFSTFASGWPGWGLLIQRALVAGIITYCVATTLSKEVPLAVVLTQVIVGAAGVLLLIGLWTPIAGAAVALIKLWMFLSGSADLCQPGVLAVLGVTLAMIGPGAWSVDARLFGRKQIEIPHS